MRKKIFSFVMSVFMVLGTLMGNSKNLNSVSAETSRDFVREPIKWRILSVDDGGKGAFVISDLCLDNRLFDESENVTWETCQIRTWLNKEFCNSAFTYEEKESIYLSEVLNRRNTGDSSYEDYFTEDYIYLLSKEELNSDYLINKQVSPSSYACDNNIYTRAYEQFDTTIKYYSPWWLRTLEEDRPYAYVVSDEGYVSNIDKVFDIKSGVRPVMHINLNSSCVLDAGEVDSDGNITQNNDGYNDPKALSKTKASWDCVYLGNYPQNTVKMNNYVTVALKEGYTERYITCDIGSQDEKGKYSKYDLPDMNVDAGEIQAYEQFYMIRCSDGTFALQSLMNRKYLTAYSVGDITRLSCCSDFIEESSKFRYVQVDPNQPELCRIKTYDSKYWLTGNFTCTNYIEDSGEFEIIVTDNNAYTQEERAILSSDEWFNMNGKGDSGVGLWNIQDEIGRGDISSLNKLGYYSQAVSIDNMQCAIGTKKNGDTYEVLIAFQGTAGWGGDSFGGETLFGDVTWNNAFDYWYNLQGKVDSNRMHEGYHKLTNMFVSESSSIVLLFDDGSRTLRDVINMAKNGNVHFTILGHSMGGAMAQIFARYLMTCDIDTTQITGRTFNPALAVTYDDELNFPDWYNICITSDTVNNGCVPGSINNYGIHRIGKTIWLYDDEPDKNIESNFNISDAKHCMDRKTKELLQIANKSEEMGTVISTNGSYVTSKSGVSSKLSPYADASKATTYPEEYSSLDVVGYTNNGVGNRWYVLADGSYIYSGNVIKIKTLSKLFKGQYYITSKNAPLRTGYSQNCSKIKDLSKDSIVYAEYAAYNPAGNLWFYVSDGTNTGWVYYQHLHVKSANPYKSLYINCPVNVSVYDQDDNLIVNIEDDTVVASNDEEKIVPNVIDSIKSIDIYDEAEYKIKIDSTNQGIMDYKIVSNYDDESGEYLDEKKYEGVELEADKSFVSNVSGDISTDETRLLLVDENNTPVSEIQTDGTETNYIEEPQKKTVEIVYDNGEDWPGNKFTANLGDEISVGEARDEINNSKYYMLMTGLDGKVFNGWLAPDGKTYSYEDTYQANEDTTFIAQYSNVFQVKYLTNGGLFSEDTYDAFDSPVKIFAPDETKPSNLENIIDTSENGINAEIIFKIVEGTDLNVGQYNEKGKMITVKRDGYNFVGWKSNLDKKTYKSGEKININKNIVLTAQWELISEDQKEADSSKQPVTEKNTSQGSQTSTQQQSNQLPTSEPQKQADTTTKKPSTAKVKAPSKVSLKSAKNEKNKKLTVKWKKVKDAKGYQVEYALNKGFTKSRKSKTIKGNTSKSLTFTAKNLKKSKVYYVRVRAYKTDAKGKKVYGKWSAVKKVTIKK